MSDEEVVEMAKAGWERVLLANDQRVPVDLLQIVQQLAVALMVTLHGGDLSDERAQQGCIAVVRTAVLVGIERGAVKGLG